MNAEEKEMDLLRLNAFVDGELAPAERAEIAARIASDRDFACAHATLARLKACVAESTAQTPALAFDMPKQKPLRRVAALATSVAAMLVVGIVVWNAIQPHRDATATPAAEGQDEIVRLAALPVRPVIPDFTAAGLKLSGVAVRHMDKQLVLVAAYSGPRGCRLELRIRSKDSPAGAGNGSREHAWTAGSLAYQLVAFGMPETRFAIIAGAAERLTRLNADPDRTEPQLRQARIDAPPCIG